MSNLEDVGTCIIGLGPAGLGAAIIFSQSRTAKRVLCLEAGVSQRERSCSVLLNSFCKRCEPCQMVTGVGGCSLLSGGKVSCYPAGRGLKRIIEISPGFTKEKLFAAFNLFKKYVSIEPLNPSNKRNIKSQEHYRKLGFNYRYYDSNLVTKENRVDGYLNMLTELVNSGMSVWLGTQAEHIRTDGSTFRIIAKKDNEGIEISAKNIILAVGRWGTFLLKSFSNVQGIRSEGNHLDVGIRLEFPTDLWPDIDAGHNDLKLHFGGARTFCVCKDGTIAPYRLGDIFLVDGYRDPKEITGLTNLAIVVRMKASEENEGIFIEIKNRLTETTGGIPLRQTLLDYLGLGSTYSVHKTKEPSISFYRWGDANNCFPSQISSRLHSAVNYFVSKVFSRKTWSEIDVFAPQVEYHWPRFIVNSDFSTSSPGIYLVGDCTGHFRGILQAFCSGIVCAERIIDKNYA